MEPFLVLFIFVVYVGIKTVIAFGTMLKLNRILGFLYRTSAVVVADEGGRAVFLTISRSNGLNSAVSVEWEMQPNTAKAAGEINFQGSLKS